MNSTCIEHCMNNICSDTVGYIVLLKSWLFYIVVAILIIILYYAIKIVHKLKKIERGMKK